MTAEPILFEPGPVSVIRLNRPPMNLVSGEMVQALDACLAVIEADDAVRAVIVTSTSEKAFSAGSDIKEFAALSGRVGEGKLIAENTMYDRLAALAAPTIAAIEGDALGGGLELALCCDLRVGSDRARFGLPELRLGVIPGSGGTQRLPRLVGLARAKEMILLGEIIDANRAIEIGLLTRTAPAGQADAIAMELAEMIATRGPLAAREAKRLLDASWGTSQTDGQALELAASERVFASDDMVEGAAAFLEKRPAEFKNR